MDRRTRIILVSVMSALLIGVVTIMAWRAGRSTGYLTDSNSIREPEKVLHPRRVLWEPPAPVAGAINTDLEEYEPRISADGVTLFFVRGKAGHNAEVYSSRWTPDGWSDPFALDAVNTPADELGPQPSRDGRSLYFCSNRAGGEGGYDLWVVQRHDGGDGWGEAFNLGPAINTVFHEYSPALSPVEQTLYFASNRPRSLDHTELNTAPWSATLRENVGRHDYDLYSASLGEDGPAPAQPVTALNSGANDGAPAFSPAGDFLYFSSDRVGAGSGGGFDLYRSRLLRGNFQPPENLGAPINSEYHELDPSLSAAGFTLHFSSNRPLASEVVGSEEGTAAVAADYNLLTSTSREVFLEYKRQEQTEIAWTWSPIWFNLLWLLLAALALLAAARWLRPGTLRSGRLSLLAKCLLASLVLHVILLFALNLWGVTTSLGELFQKPGGHRVIVSGSGEGGDTGDGAGDISSQLRGGLTQFTVEASGAGAIDGPVLEIAAREESAVESGVERGTVTAAALVTSGASESSAIPARTDPTIPEVAIPDSQSNVATPAPATAQAVAEADQPPTAQDPVAVEPGPNVVATQPEPVESVPAPSQASDGVTTLSPQRPDARVATVPRPLVSPSAQNVAQGAPVNVDQPHVAPATSESESEHSTPSATVPSVAAPAPAVDPATADQVPTSAPAARDVASGAITAAAANDARPAPAEPSPKVNPPAQPAPSAVVAVPSAPGGASVPERFSSLTAARPQSASVPSTSVIAPAVGDSTIQSDARPSSAKPAAGMAIVAAREFTGPLLLPSAQPGPSTPVPTNVQVQVPVAAVGASGVERQGRPSGLSVAVVEAPVDAAVGPSEIPGMIQTATAPSREVPASRLAGSQASDAASTDDQRTALSGAERATPAPGQPALIAVPVADGASIASEATGEVSAAPVGSVDGPVGAVAAQSAAPNAAVASPARPARVRGTSNLADARASDAVTGAGDQARAMNTGQRAASAPAAQQSPVAIPSVAQGEATSEVDGSLRTATVGSVQAPNAPVTATTPTDAEAIAAPSTARPAPSLPAGSLATGRASESANSPATAIALGAAAIPPRVEPGKVSLPKSAESSPGVAAGEATNALSAAVPTTLASPSASVESVPEADIGVIATSAAPSRSAPSTSLAPGSVREARAAGAKPGPSEVTPAAGDVPLMDAQTAVPGSNGTDSPVQPNGAAAAEAGSNIGAPASSSLARPSPDATTIVEPSQSSGGPAGGTAPTRDVGQSSLAATDIRESKRNSTAAANSVSDAPPVIDVQAQGGPSLSLPQEQATTLQQPQGSERGAVAGTAAAVTAASRAGAAGPAVPTTVDAAAPGQQTSLAPARPGTGASLRGSGASDARTRGEADAASHHGSLGTPGAPALDVESNSGLKLPTEIDTLTQREATDAGVGAGGMDIALRSRPRVEVESIQAPVADVQTGVAPASVKPASLVGGGDASGRDAPVYGDDPGNARWGLRLPEATTTDVAVPTEAATPEDPYKQRAPDIRNEIVERLGGSDETEQAVATSLQWLAKHQSRDGRWDSTQYDDDCGRCGGEPSIDSDTAVTGLALLCYLGADHTHMKQGPYRERVGRGIDWLLSRQGKDGDLRGGGTMYSHGIAAIAISEAYGMTKDERLRKPVEQAIAFIVTARNTERGGWRYEPGQYGDTSVMGWQVMALESAKRSGLAVPASAFQGAAQWLAMVSEGSPGLYAYQPGQPPTPAMTAEGLFVRQLLGHGREEPMMQTSVLLIAQNPPDWNKGANTYYWYYATLAMFQEQGDQWPRWNAALTGTLLANQRKDGPAAGSWDPADKWSTIGGRVYQTAICTLSLEVYYRYLPLYGR